MTERIATVMRSVLGVATGLLSLKQYENGTVSIGGGWQGIGDRERGGVELHAGKLLGNVRLAATRSRRCGRRGVVADLAGARGGNADALPPSGRCRAFRARG